MVNTALVFDKTISSFESSFSSYSTNMVRYNVIIIIAAVIFLFLIFCCCWRPYLNNLNKDIWRTKGMLSMIPTTVIKSNKALEDAIINGDLIEAVK